MFEQRGYVDGLFDHDPVSFRRVGEPCGDRVAAASERGGSSVAAWSQGDRRHARRGRWGAREELLASEVGQVVVGVDHGDPLAPNFGDEARQLGDPGGEEASRRPPSVASPVVRICENPSVLAAAADALGPACPPLICLQGQPSAAALALLRHLHGNGSDLRYHGDFDWGGLRIAGALLRRVPWRPWRYSAADYRAALTASDPELPLGPLTGAQTRTPWDPDLAEALAEAGIRVEEERELDLLLSDLRGRP